jgi:hypothetical protein
LASTLKPVEAVETLPTPTAEIPRAESPPATTSSSTSAVAASSAAPSPTSIATAPRVPRRLKLVSPGNGRPVVSVDLPLVVVEGDTEDPDVNEVWIIANDRRLPVAVRGGHFRKLMPLFEPELRLRVENLDASLRSDTVTIRTIPTALPAAVLVFEPISDDRLTDYAIAATWRTSPSQLDVAPGSVPLAALIPPSTLGTPAAYGARNLAGGVYTFTVTRTAASAVDVRPVLYLARNGVVTTHRLRAITSTSDRPQVVAKLLLPEGVFWDQDDWFSGRSEGADTITKFRFPEGIAWIERKRDLP